MRQVLKTLLVILIVVLGGALMFLSARRKNRQEGNTTTPVRAMYEDSRTSVVTAEMAMTRMEAVKAAPAITPSNTIDSVATQRFMESPALPTGMVYKPIIPLAGAEVLLPILDVVSNAVLSVDGILKSKQCKKVEQFNRTVWLEAMDKIQSTIWRIIPFGTNGVVGGIKAIVYQDDSFSQKDATRSFQAEFFPHGSSLRMFWWDDLHEMLTVYTNGPFSVDYVRDLGGKKSLEMRWDQRGNLVSSNIYNWATRGRVIGGTAQTNRSAYRFGPTSAVETLTGSQSWER